ncbi:glycerol dehydratase reactivase beta/small subunit family protein [Desulfitibacter alkalitolerans]|uniref:glycerol dehydratase reactivase beta/small subunit family protein n=1 Tax=Desulfitibacter alkalitolerans TaxID=264641 RepID=UPI0009FF5EA8|nr:glycerol dehydratase reactivase beta/small subunit family protein [Desulfitibacter alkalitolerans]
MQLQQVWSCQLQMKSGECMLEKRMVKPHVCIAIDKNFDNKPLIREVTAGLEEEGIPYRIILSEGDAVTLAIEAAAVSHFEAGIGVGSDHSIAVSQNRQSFNKPLFYVSGTEGRLEIWRVIGSNAARMVKGIPFKELNQDFSKGNNVNCEFEDLVKAVAREVQKMLSYQQI